MFKTLVSALLIFSTSLSWGNDISATDSSAQNFKLVKIWFIGASGEVQMQIENESTRVGAIVNIIFHRTITWAETLTYSLDHRRGSPPELGLSGKELKTLVTELTGPLSGAIVNIIPAIVRRGSAEFEAMTTAQGVYVDTGPEKLVNQEILPQARSMDPKIQFTYFRSYLKDRELTLRSQCFSLFSIN